MLAVGFCCKAGDFANGWPATKLPKVIGTAGNLKRGKPSSVKLTEEDQASSSEVSDSEPDDDNEF